MASKKQIEKQIDNIGAAQLSNDLERLYSRLSMHKILLSPSKVKAMLSDIDWALDYIDSL